MLLLNQTATTQIVGGVGSDSITCTQQIAAYRHPVLGILLAFFSISTIFGNVMVMLAVVSARYLHTVTNYLIISLAVADLIVGLLIMPFNIVFEMTYLRDPLTYPGVMSVKRCSMAVALVWVGSAVISFPAIAWWRHESPDLYKNHCKCEFVDDFSYLCFSSLVSFYVPLLIMLFAYLKVYRAAAEYERSLKSGTKTTKGSGGGGTSAVNLRMHRGGGAKDKKSPAQGNRKISRQLTASSGSPDSRALANFRQCSTASLSSSEKNQSSITPDIGIGCDSPILETRKTATNSQENGQAESFALVLSPFIAKKNARKGLQRTLARFTKEKKAAKTLGIVVGFFAICWVPFFILNVLNGICPKCVKNREILFTVFTWLGHCNSFLNPLIYTCFNRDFRRAFRQMLGLRKSRNATHAQIVKKASTVSNGSAITSQEGNDRRNWILQNNPFSDFRLMTKTSMGGDELIEMRRT